MWILLTLMMSLQAAPCPDSVIAEAQTVRQRQDRVSEMAFLERRLRGCVPSTWVRFETANRYIELSESLKGDKSQSAYLDKGFWWARSAVRIDPRNSLSHEILATAFAAKLNQSGLMGQMRLADSVRVHAQRAVDLDPRNPRALHILGRWHHELANLGWVTSLFAGMVTQADVATAPATALKHFREAFRHQDSIQNRYWLGKALADGGAKTETRRLYAEAVAMRAGTDAEKSMQADMRAWLRMNPR
jgi:hypothetical protein